MLVSYFKLILNTKEIEMSREYEQVVEFNRVILGLEQRPHGLQSYAEAQLSFVQLKEESIEYLEAVTEKDLVKCVDACVDSIVFAMGILYKMGVTEEEFSTIFEVVMGANMTKKMGVKKGREGYDAADAYKPDDFVPPEEIIADILATGK